MASESRGRAQGARKYFRLARAEIRAAGTLSPPCNGPREHARTLFAARGDGARLHAPPHLESGPFRRAVSERPVSYPGKSLRGIAIGAGKLLHPTEVRRSPARPCSGVRARAR